MLCSFTEKTLILRLYGQGVSLRANDAQWQEYLSLFPAIAGTRQIVRVNVESVQTSCGFAVPFYEFLGDRPTLKEWAETKGEDGVHEYRQNKNRQSIDGLPTGI